jgi:outer membrane receptor protein involved in Fe transport
MQAIHTCVSARKAARSAGRALIALALLTGGVLAPTLSAQQTVTLQGQVTGDEGQLIVGADIAALNLETNTPRRTVTNSSGAFSIVGLTPGPYEITASMIGYAATQRRVDLHIGQRAVVDIRMETAAVELEGISVIQREGSFEVKRTDVSSPVVQVEIQNLPLNTRNVINLATIVPGMKTYAPTAGRSLPSSGSLPELRFWNFYLDGAEWKSMFNGNLVGIPQTGSPMPQEALREFRVQLNPYDAEYTRGASYIINAVTHRGTNEFHGSGFIFHQDNQLRALDHFQREAKQANPDGFSIADYGRQQLGFNLRGPIVRDRLFFSASYELNNEDNAITVVPGSGAFSQYGGTFTAPTKNHTGLLRLTAPAGQNHTLDATWAARVYDSETHFGGTVARDGGINAAYTIHSAQLRDTFTPSASLVNEFSLNFLSWEHDESPLRPGPELSYPSILLGRSGFPLVLEETHIRAINKVTYTPPGGRHLLKGGIELARVNTSSFLPASADGSFVFATDDAVMPLRATIGVGYNDPHSTQDARAETGGWVVGAYVQNQWEALDNLTLTMGLRYDAEINTLNNDFHSPFADDPELRQLLPDRFLNQANRKNDLSAIAPRFSFSWDPFRTGETFVRGGAGIMYDRIAGFIPFFEKVNATWRTYTFENPGTTDVEELRSRVIEGEGASTPNLTVMSTEMKTPRNTQFSLGVGHQFTSALSVNLDYINQYATNLYVSMALNPFIANEGRRALTDSYGNITAYDNIGSARFQALLSELIYDTDRLRLRGAYTLGWYKSEFTGLGGYARPESFNMQPSTGDERHRLVLSGIVRLPQAVTLSAITVLATPRPFGVFIGQDISNSGLFNDDWPNGRRTMRPENDWENMYRTVDFRLAKGFGFGGVALTLTGEVFNAFNWTSFSGYAGRMQDAAGNPLANFGEPTGVYAPRQAQVGLRFAF